MSEEGIALRIPDIPGMKKGDTFRVVVTTEHYRAALNATCVYSRAEEFLAATVSPVDEESRRNWMQIIHDRKHSLPREIDPWMTVYDEVCRNIRMRWERR